MCLKEYYAPGFTFYLVNLFVQSQHYNLPIIIHRYLAYIYKYLFTNRSHSE